MSSEPQIPRDEEELDNDVDVTSDTHVPEEEDGDGSSVFHDDDDEPIRSPGVSVSDVSLRDTEQSPLQDYLSSEWTPGEPETFSSPTGNEAVEKGAFQPTDKMEPSEDDTDAPTVVIKGKRPDGPPSNPEFEAATEPLPPPQSLQLDFTPPTAGKPEDAIDFPREERPEALPLPAFEPLSPPSLDTPSARTEPAAQESPAPPKDDSDAMAPLRGPEMESGLPLPSIAAVPALDSSRSAPKPSSPAGSKTSDDKPAPKPKDGKGGSGGGIKLGQVLLLSYASALTLIVIMMMMRGTSAKPHHLESLPDVVPEPENKLSYVPVNATLAPGHTLKLGEKRRFGNIEVEALKVTQEPLQFRHYTGNSSKKKPETAPVLKLWLRFTNVSSDQTIAPLDRTLLLRWVAKAGSTIEFSNQYLFPANKQNDPSSVVSTYRMPQTSDWDLVGQELDTELAPGESYETFIASTDDGTAELKGPITWRVQMRKGFSPKGYGVTTEIEVDFNSSEVRKG